MDIRKKERPAGESNDFQSLIVEFIESISSYAELVKNTVINYRSIYTGIRNEISDKIIEVSERTSKNQWVLPCNITIPFILKIYNVECSGNQLNEEFTNYFLDDDEKELKETIKKISEDKNLIESKTIFNQAVYNYNEKKYFSSTVVLMIIYENLCIEFIKYKSTTKIYKVMKEFRDKISNEDFINFSNSICIKWFTESIYKSEKSGAFEDKTMLNRHIILHGRDITERNQVDCIKMFNAIEVILNTLNNKKEVEELIHDNK